MELKSFSSDFLARECANAYADDFVGILSSASRFMENQLNCGSIHGGKVTGSLVEISTISKLAVIGDLHGDSATLYRILDRLNFDSFLTNPENKLVFLGDYVDRGSDSIGVLYTVAWLKSRYPDSVVLLTGNHECPVKLPFASHDLPQEVRTRFKEERSAARVYREILSFFELLSLTAIVNGTAIIVHGGLPVDKKLDNFRFRISNAKGDQTWNGWMEELLWNDPRLIDMQGQEWVVSRRGYGKHFGPSVSERWLNLTNTRAIIRGHEPCMGYRLDHSDTVLTVFSSIGPYPRFKAAYLEADHKELEKISNARDLSEHITILDS